VATKPWKEIRKQHSKLSGAKQQEIDRAVQREVLEMRLRELREMAGKTQAEVADALEKVQAEISQFENRPDHMLSTLREYVRALGGKLEVIARFGDKSVQLRDV
jgi:DNA-binding XRE family transcriptional regulator